MDRKANIINSPMLNFNCLPTLASEVTTCFRCTLAFIRQLKLSDSPICEHNNFLHIHTTLVSVTAETVTLSPLVVVLPGIWCGFLSHPGLKGAIFSSSAHIHYFLLIFCFVLFFKARTSIHTVCWYWLDYLWPVLKDERGSRGWNENRWVILQNSHYKPSNPLQCSIWRRIEIMEHKCTFFQSACLARTAAFQVVLVHDCS